MKENHSALIILAIFIGLITGLLSIAFHSILDFLFNTISFLFNKNIIYIISIPILGSIIVGLIRTKLLKPNNQGFSVEQVMHEIENINLLVMKPIEVLYKILGFITSLVTGFCVGRQGPIVHIGGAIGSNIAYFFKQTKDDTRILIGCGVAGALAGSFNAPIFATLFVVEILFAKKYFNMISIILFSSVSSTLLVNFLDKDNPLINLNMVFNYDLNEIFYFVVLGLFIGLISSMYSYSIRKTKSLFGKLKYSHLTKSIIGGVIISLSLVLISNIYTYNFSPFELLTSDNSIISLSLLIPTYILLTSISIGTGSMGGIFAPGLYIGIASGLLIEKVFSLFNLNISNPNVYAVAGMGAMFAGFANAPLAGAIMVIEITKQYNLLIPVLVATISSSLITDLIYGDSIYHQNLVDLLKSDLILDKYFENK